MKSLCKKNIEKFENKKLIFFEKISIFQTTNFKTLEKITTLKMSQIAQKEEVKVWKCDGCDYATWTTSPDTESDDAGDSKFTNPGHLREAFRGKFKGPSDRYMTWLHCACCGSPAVIFDYRKNHGTDSHDWNKGEPLCHRCGGVPKNPDTERLGPNYYCGRVHWAPDGAYLPPPFVRPTDFPWDDAWLEVPYVV